MSQAPPQAPVKRSGGCGTVFVVFAAIGGGLLLLGGLSTAFRGGTDPGPGGGYRSGSYSVPFVDPDPPLRRGIVGKWKTEVKDTTIWFNVHEDGTMIVTSQARSGLNALLDGIGNMLGVEVHGVWEIKNETLKMTNLDAPKGTAKEPAPFSLRIKRMENNKIELADGSVWYRLPN